jgi:AbrB family looped-hinge helix DNA binding protein
VSKVTTKLQVTLPKPLAEQLGINPGDQIDWEVAGEVLRVIPAAKRRREKRDTQARLRLFDQATRRQRKRQSSTDHALLRTARSGRGWTRQELYNCGDNRSVSLRNVQEPDHSERRNKE